MHAVTKLEILESVMRSVQVGTLVLDNAQGIVLWNDWIDQHAYFDGAHPVRGQQFVDLFPHMANGRTHAAIREALENNFPSVISQTLNKAPFPLYASSADRALDNRIQQAVQVIPIDVADLPRHCLVQIIDVSKTVLRERLLREQSAALKNLSYTDGLTGIANRRRFDERIDEEFARARRAHTALSVFIIDIDFFKLYNDNHGHQQGDKCLRDVARALEAVLQRPADLLARYGGEEFAAILPDTDAEGAQHLAETMRAAIAACAFDHPFSLVADCVTVSIGVATRVPAQEDVFSQLISTADLGLYEAKRAGRNCVRMIAP